MSTIRAFFRLEAAGGIVLFLAAAVAMAVANSPLLPAYSALVDLPFGVRLAEWSLDKPLLHWINDGLMAVFFLVVGLEIKREMRGGALSDPRQVALPLAAAAGGMAMPALIYCLFNWGDAEAMRGWAIPAATDIAFALGVLALLGSRVPIGAKLFLTAVAVFDDLGAIVIIAAFYTVDLSLPALGLAVVALLTLAAMNRAGVASLGAYLFVGAMLWLCVLESGVHATLAGVATALAIPQSARDAAPDAPGPLAILEHRLQPWVAFGILPVFAFANAGVPLEGVSFASLAEPIRLGISSGLVLGKAIGVFGVSWLMVRTGLAPLPEGTSVGVLFGVALLCGIGFTMSLFIGTLAFPGPEHATALRLGVIGGSIVAAVLGSTWLALQLRRVPLPPEVQ